LSFLRELKGWLGMDGSSNTRASDVTRANALFVYIKMPGDIDPLDRGERFEDPLEEALTREGLGTITGGGSQLSEPDDDGDRSVEFCGIDVDLYNVENGLALLRRELIHLEAPLGTLLLYELDGHEYEEPIHRPEI
jgi:hypothetical protein